jgi:hypothetical protein
VYDSTVDHSYQQCALTNSSARVFFETKDEESGNHIFLGAFASALPHSRALRKKGIKSVLSALYFDTSIPLDVAFDRNDPTVVRRAFASSRL